MRAKLILESSFHDYHVDDILSDKYLKKIKNDGYFEDLIDWYKTHFGITDENDDDILDSDEFLDFIRDEFEENFEVAKQNIYYKINDQGKLLIYRAITVDDNWLHHLKTQGKRLGVYWSWDENAIETHWGYNDKKNLAVIEVEIDEKYVDWVTTFELNSHPYYIEEKEIRLYKNTPIKLKSIKINNKKININIIKNKIFYA